MKKYQIFISSTYTDLQEERQAVLECVLKLRQIPVGMEHFVASNEEQFEYIKRLLEDTDYYIIIIGNRYGSLADDGISYTEKEFDYAVSLNIPVIAFVHSNPDSLPVNKSETDKEKIEKLQNFRKKVMHNRMVSYRDWTNPASLSVEVLSALTNVMNDTPRQGWKRAESCENSELLAQINNLRRVNEELSEKLKAVEKPVNDKKLIYKFNWRQKIHISASADIDHFPFRLAVETVLSWKQCFSIFGRILLRGTYEKYVRDRLSSILFLEGHPQFMVSPDSFELIITEFLRLNLVYLYRDESGQRVYLTQEGVNFLGSTTPVGNDVLKISHQRVLSIIEDDEKRQSDLLTWDKEFDSIAWDSENDNVYNT